MKKTVALITSLSLCFALFPATNALAEESNYNTYTSQLSAMIQKYDSDDYFATMSVTIGEPNLVIDGVEIPIDDSGSVAYVENGRTMMPVRGIAEAIGAEVDYDGDSRIVTVENEDTMIAMRIGDNEMEVNGQPVMLLTAPEIKEDRTMLPVRDVAEALDCEVEWQQETQTATFTRPYQTKRIVVQSENADTSNAITFFSAEGKTVIQFDNIEDAKTCVEINNRKGLNAEPDYVRSLQDLSWGIDMIGGKKYHSQTSYASGSAVVAVIDTGIDYNHEFFKNRIIGGYDLYYYDDYAEDTDGHGTHVASTVIDVASSNDNVKVMPLKVFANGADSCSSTTVAEAIRYAADHGADVINLSLGGQHRSEIEQQAIDYANSKNVAVVAAAGNESLNLEITPYSPGGLDGVITVSAMTKDKNLASFSNYGNGVVEFTAPGVSIKGAQMGGGYCNMGGTSMASPHVAGVYALAKATHPDLPTDEITAALEKNADSLGNTRYYGAGIIKANMLEQYLSKMYFSDIEATNITESNALISGEIGYVGIIPETIGVKINNKEVYSVRYKDNGNNEMVFKCDLSENASYTLKAGTTYEAKIFTNQGGYILNTDSIRFTTEGTPSQPEPTPEPEPDKSELRILPENYPTGSLEQGSKYNLSGRIKSNYHITGVRSYLLDENKNVVQESSGSTTTATYVIEKSNLDTGLKFEKLQPGTYYLKYYAEDETGNKVSWISDGFQVKGKATEEPVGPTVSAVVLIPDNFDNLSIRTGPSTNYDIVGSMNHTVKCIVYTDKTENGWYYVEYGGVKGYAAGNYIYLPSETKTGTVNIPSSWDNLSIRTGPSTNYKIVGSMNHGEKCTVFTDKAKNGWYFVEYNGVYGYASGNCID